MVTHMINLAISYSRSKNYAEAERLLRRSLKIMIKQKGTDDQSINFPMLHLAVTLYHLKQDEEAKKFSLQVLCIREKAFGEDSLRVGEFSPLTIQMLRKWSFRQFSIQKLMEVGDVVKSCQLDCHMVPDYKIIFKS